MKTWAVANQKGGVGKTTTVVSLGGLLSQRGKRTLLVDLDPHGSMTVYFGYDPDQLERSVYHIFQKKGLASAAEIHDLVLPTKFDRLALLPASTALATLDRQLSGADGMGLVLKRALNAIGARYDYVLIDCPPLLGVSMVNALAACDQLIVPVQTEFLAMKGLERMLRTLVMVSKSLKQVLHYTIVPTMFDRRTRASLSVLRALRENYAGDVWPSVIPVDTQFREVSKLGIPLPLHAPSDRGSLAYAELLDALLTERIAVPSPQAMVL